jgi:hypothetical protein
LLLQQEIRRLDFSYFIDEPPSMAQGGRGVCVPGCRKQLQTMNQFMDHLANDVLPKVIEIEETARLDESYTLIPLKHLASCQIGGSR